MCKRRSPSSRLPLVRKLIERAVLAQFMAPWHAQLLTQALTLAFELVQDKKVPLWKRADVLGGVAIAVIILCLAIGVHYYRGKSG